MSEYADIKIKNDFEIKQPLFMIAAIAMFVGLAIASITDLDLGDMITIVVDLVSLAFIPLIFLLSLKKIIRFNTGLAYLVYIGSVNFVLAAVMYSISPIYPASDVYRLTSNLYIMMVFMAISGFILSKSSAIVFGLLNIIVIIINLLFKNDPHVQENAILWIMIAAVFAVILFYYRNSLEKLIKQLYETHDREQNLRKTAIKNLEDLQKAQTQIIAQEKLASLGSLTAGIAHEIKNPLNFVTNFSESSIELLSELKEHIEKVKSSLKEADAEDVDYLIEELEKNMRDIVHHGRRGDNIVKSMLMHSRTGTQTFTEEYFTALVEECLNLSFHGMRAKYEDFKVDISNEFVSNLPKLKLVRGDMARVLINIFSNAMYSVYQRSKMKEADYKPELKIRMSLVDDIVVLSIRDNGLGLSEEVKAKLFQPFFTTKPTGEGTGLGLSMAFEIVTKLHKGSIEIDGALNKFAQFNIKIPLDVVGEGET